MEKFGTKIKRRRKELGFSQTKLGAMVGVSGATISMWESDTNSPKTENFLNLAKALNLTVDELIANIDMDFLDEETLVAIVKSSYPKLSEARRRALMAALMDMEFQIPRT